MEKRYATGGFWHIIFSCVWIEGLGKKTKRLQMQIDYKELNLNKRTKWKRKRILAHYFLMCLD